MGPSGSGKSTLLNLLGCLDRPTAGSYRLEDREVAALPDRELVEVRRHKIGFIFQSFHLVPRLDARANVELPMVFAGVDPKERAGRASRALDSVGLSARADHRPAQLSGGERQRVATARAVAMDPPLLLADEPTGNLDRAAGVEVMGLLTELNRRGRTIVVVTHNDEIAKYGQRVLRLVDGQLVS